jgi:hypothetical protein
MSSISISSISIHICISSKWEVVNVVAIALSRVTVDTTGGAEMITKNCACCNGAGDDDGDDDGDGGTLAEKEW